MLLNSLKNFCALPYRQSRGFIMKTFIETIRKRTLIAKISALNGCKLSLSRSGIIPNSEWIMMNNQSIPNT